MDPVTACEECKENVEWTADGICTKCIRKLRGDRDASEELRIATAKEMQEGLAFIKEETAALRVDIKGLMQERDSLKSDYGNMENARECYFAAGGIESDVGPRDVATWYWRRAAKLWMNKSERSDGLAHYNHAMLKNFSDNCQVEIDKLNSKLLAKSEFVEGLVEELNQVREMHGNDLIELEGDKERLDWLVQHSYAFVRRKDTGKGFIRLSDAYLNDPNDYGLRKGLDEARGEENVGHFRPGEEGEEAKDSQP